jgi:hypothetical protein
VPWKATQSVTIKKRVEHGFAVAAQIYVPPSGEAYHERDHVAALNDCTDFIDSNC